LIWTTLPTPLYEIPNGPQFEDKLVSTQEPWRVGFIDAGTEKAAGVEDIAPKPDVVGKEYGWSIS
jgi:hypothetical protein